MVVDDNVVDACVAGACIHEKCHCFQQLAYRRRKGTQERFDLCTVKVSANGCGSARKMAT